MYYWYHDLKIGMGNAQNVATAKMAFKFCRIFFHWQKCLKKNGFEMFLAQIYIQHDGHKIECHKNTYIQDWPQAAQTWPLFSQKYVLNQQKLDLFSPKDASYHVHD